MTDECETGKYSEGNSKKSEVFPVLDLLSTTP
jgi:hypothetical protein